MKLANWNAFATTAALLVAVLFSVALLSGCDTATHGSAPSKSGDSTAKPADLAIREVPDEANPAPAEQDQVAAATTDPSNEPEELAEPEEPVTADPMPRPVRDGEVVEIKFDDVNLKMQADMVFRPWLLTDRVKELEGRKIRITGVMYPENKFKGMTEFILLKNINCPFGPGGQADHLMTIKMKKGDSADYFGDQPVSVEGVLRVNPFQGPDGYTWSVYDLEAAENVTIVRR